MATTFIEENQSTTIKCHRVSTAVTAGKGLKTLTPFKGKNREKPVNSIVNLMN